MTISEKREMVEAVLNASSTCPELREACKVYLSETDAGNEKSKAAMLISELEEDVCKLDNTLAFFESDAAKGIFGDALEGMLAAARAAKANGETVCICDGCRAGVAILEKKDEFLK